MITRQDLTHNNLIQILKNLGYTNIDKGVCMGLAMMASQAFTSKNGFSLFDKRIKFLESYLIDYQKCEKLVNNIKLKLIDHTASQLEKRFYSDYIDAMSFLENLMIFQDSAQFTQLFTEPVMQGDINKISPVSQSAEMEKHGGLIQLPTVGGIFTINMLSEYLGKLRQTFAANQLNANLIVGPPNHAICVCYNSHSNKWIIFDANKFDETKNFRVEYEVDTHDKIPTAIDDFVAKLICQHALMITTRDLFRYQSLDEKFLLSIRPIGTHDNIDSLTKTFNAFKATETYRELDKITIDDAKKSQLYDDGEQINLLKWSIMENNADKIHQLHALILNINEGFYERLKPLEFAMHYGSTHSIQALLECGENVNQIYKQARITMAHEAASKGQIDILRIFDKFNGNWDLKDIYKRTPLDIAKEEKKHDVILFITSVKNRNLLLSKLDKLVSKVNSENIELLDALKHLREEVRSSWENCDKRNAHEDFSKKESYLYNKIGELAYHINAQNKGNIKYHFFKEAPSTVSHSTELKTNKVQKKP